MTLYHLIFFLTAVTAVFIQSKSRTLQDLPEELMNEDLHNELSRLLKIRRFMSPFIAGLTALLILMITARHQLWNETLPRFFVPVWALASIGDIYIEGAYSIEDKKKQERFYLIGMILFMAMTLLLGIGLMVNAGAAASGRIARIISIGLPVLLGIGAFFTMKLDKDTLGPMIVYDVAVSVLLCGGLFALFAGQYQMAYIGMGYFISDWLVGTRDFGKWKPAFLDRWILLFILLIYYSIMILSVDGVLKLVPAV
ncbi:MAG: hypothetical protein PQJ58_05385 [Spirochaetales bacterium]|nr:hypothetical protein [Spirochaetales bacterium]